jgi:hypothetical protein
MVTQPLPPEAFQYKIKNPAVAQGTPASLCSMTEDCSNDGHVVDAGFDS